MIYLAAAAAHPSPLTEAKAKVAYELTDPASAQFRNLKFNSDAVCGQVNAKNQMGGYVGFRGFVYERKDKHVSFEPSDPKDFVAQNVWSAFERDCPS